jgi:hypothetical protein
VKRAELTAAEQALLAALRQEHDVDWWDAMYAGRSADVRTRYAATMQKVGREVGEELLRRRGVRPQTPEELRELEGEDLARSFDPGALKPVRFVAVAVALALAGALTADDLPRVVARAGEHAAAQSLVGAVPGLEVSPAARRTLAETYARMALEAALAGRWATWIERVNAALRPKG